VTLSVQFCPFGVVTPVCAQPGRPSLKPTLKGYFYTNLVGTLVLVWMYARLAKREEQEAVVEFGDAYRRYAAQTPAFFPRLVLKTT
jgi:protein-S-isoprenylcysteine O-methyltransferase Ste14